MNVVLSLGLDTRIIMDNSYSTAQRDLDSCGYITCVFLSC